jgi:hypothetical protein
MFLRTLWKFCSQTPSIQVEVFWVVTPCSVVVGYQHFGGPCYLHLQGEVTTPMFLFTHCWRSQEENFLHDLKPNRPILSVDFAYYYRRLESNSCQLRRVLKAKSDKRTSWNRPPKVSLCCSYSQEELCKEEADSNHFRLSGIEPMYREWAAVEHK